MGVGIAAGWTGSWRGRRRAPLLLAGLGVGPSDSLSSWHPRRLPAHRALASCCPWEPPSRANCGSESTTTHFHLLSGPQSPHYPTTTLTYSPRPHRQVRELQSSVSTLDRALADQTAANTQLSQEAAGLRAELGEVRQALAGQEAALEAERKQAAAQAAAMEELRGQYRAALAALETSKVDGPV